MTENLTINHIPLITPAHHSIGDWDFQAQLGYALDSAIYVVEPSSLRLTSWVYGLYLMALCRRSNVLCLPDGQIHTWMRHSDRGRTEPVITFRHQSPLGSVAFDNCYWATFDTAYVQLILTVDGVTHRTWLWTLANPINTWLRRRITWWMTATTLNFQLDYWDGSNWVQFGDILSDPNPPWTDSDVNRVGLGVNLTDPGYYDWFDETYILGPGGGPGG